MKKGTETFEHAKRRFFESFDPPISEEALRLEIDGLAARWESYAVYFDEAYHRHEAALLLLREALKVVQGEGNLPFLREVAEVLKDGSFDRRKGRRGRINRTKCPPEWIAKALKNTRARDTVVAIQRTISQVEQLNGERNTQRKEEVQDGATRPETAQERGKEKGVSEVDQRQKAQQAQARAAGQGRNDDAPEGTGAEPGRAVVSSIGRS
jgi:hypothetical protein